MATTNLKYHVKFRQKQSAKNEFENWSQTDLINYILELRKELELKNKEEVAFINKQEQPINTFNGNVIIEQSYKQEWSFPTKIVFLLNLKNKPLTSVEMHTQLLQLDKSYKKLKTPKKTLASILTRTVKSKRISKIKQAGIKELLFSLPE